jgi:uncharacterized protein
MKILVSDLEQSSATWPIVNDGWFPVTEVNLVGEPSGRIDASLISDGDALVSGSMEVRIALPCDRCCTRVVLEIAADFSYVCTIGSEEYETGRNDIECREEDYNKLYLKEPVIDTGELLREQLYLNIPPRILCRRSCRGLCQACGVDLNIDRCNCEPAPIDSPFAVLRRLKDR